MFITRKSLCTYIVPALVPVCVGAKLVFDTFWTFINFPKHVFHNLQAKYRATFWSRGRPGLDVSDFVVVLARCRCIFVEEIIIQRMFLIVTRIGAIGKGVKTRRAFVHQNILTVHRVCALHQRQNKRGRDNIYQNYAKNNWRSAVVYNLQKLVKIYGPTFMVNSADDAERISLIVRQWDTDKWAPVMDQYITDLRDLYERAPSLKYPMISYRGEQKKHVFGNLATSEANTEKRIISSSLDPSVAAFFTYELHNPEKYTVGPGTIYTITWPAGSKLLMTLGTNLTADLMETEVRALQPRFRLCGSGLDGADYTGVTTKKMKIQFMRPIKTKRDTVGLEEIEYGVAHLEAY